MTLKTSTSVQPELEPTPPPARLHVAPPPKKIRVLLTVPHLNPTASPWRETMSMARYLNRDKFQLTVCALRDGGRKPAEKGHECDRHQARAREDLLSHVTAPSSIENRVRLRR